MKTPDKLRTLVQNVIKEVKAEKTQKKEKEKEKPKNASKTKVASKKDKLPKSSGKLMEMKKELSSLKKMCEQLRTANVSQTINEDETMVEFADLQPYLTELSTIKESSLALEQKINGRINELEQSISEEKNKIREMIGLESPKPLGEIKKEKK